MGVDSHWLDWRGWLKLLRENGEGHMFFWISLLFGAYFLFGVPQIANVWQQLPPLGLWWLFYFLFLLPTLAFYIGSVFFVLDLPLPWRRHIPAAPAESGDQELRALMSPTWYSRLGNALYTFSRKVVGRTALFLVLLFPWISPWYTSRWLVFLSSAPDNPGNNVSWWRRRHGNVSYILRSPWCGAAVTIVGVVALGLGSIPDASAPYPLVGSFCRGLGLILGGIGLWLISGARPLCGPSKSVRLGCGFALLIGGTPMLLRGLGVQQAEIISMVGTDNHLIGVVCRGISWILVGFGCWLLLTGLKWDRRELTRFGIIVLIGGVVVLLDYWLQEDGVAPDEDAPYPLAEVFCGGLGLILTFIGIRLFIHEQPQEFDRRPGGDIKLGLKLLILLLGVGFLSLGLGIQCTKSGAQGVYFVIGALCRLSGWIVAGLGFWLVFLLPHPGIKTRIWFWIVVQLAAIGVCMEMGSGRMDARADNGISAFLMSVACCGLGLILAGIWLWWFLIDSIPKGSARLNRAIVVIVIGILMLWAAWGRQVGADWDARYRFFLLDTVFLKVAWILAGLGLCLLFHTGTPSACEDSSPKGRLYIGRLLGWLLVTAVVGETLWLGAYHGDPWGLFSYRLYTIWAIIQALTFLILLGLLIDRFWHLHRAWPVRQIAAAVVVVSIWGFSRWETLSWQDAERHLSPDQLINARLADVEATADRTRAADRRKKLWFDQFKARLASIPPAEGPVVFVAASGGGSRAAIFTALTLEALKRTPLNPQVGGRTWADNIVLISSVSGGSLATAYYVHGLGSSEDELPNGLRNTTESELRDRLATLAEKDLGDYPAKLVGRQQERLRDFLAQQTREQERVPATAVEALHGEDAEERREAYRDILRSESIYEALVQMRSRLRKQGALPVRVASAVGCLGWGQGYGPLSVATLLSLREVERDDFTDRLTEVIARIKADAYARGQRAEWDWVLKKKAFDEMCLDFMAPIMRGLLSVSLDRGDALARFWTHRFHWENATNFNGYGVEAINSGHKRFQVPVNVPNYQPHHPLVLFNTCDVAHGSRLVIGFPPIPDRLWDLPGDLGRTSYARPKSLNSYAPGFRVSLARAVRLSSNFPYGFRVEELALPRGVNRADTRSVHMLDGGVIDNTGLDTIYELLNALKDHGESERPSDLTREASDLLDDLRKRGVVILEIDSGAKPSQHAPARFDPLVGPREPLQALDNASFTNAEVVKQYYVREINAILNAPLDRIRAFSAETSGSSDLRPEIQPKTTVKVRLQCNHYLPSQKENDPEVMTAWTLGPKDKAQIVHRFLIELEMWDQQSKEAYWDVQRGLRARDAALLAAISALFRPYQTLYQDVLAGMGSKELSRRRDELDKQFTHLQYEVKGIFNIEVNRAWALLESQQKRVVDQIDRPGKSPGKPSGWAFTTLSSSVGKAASWIDEVRIAGIRREFEQKPVNPLEIPVVELEDPQRKYDRRAIRTKILIESPSPR
jgi:hypothetical protein